MRLINADAYAYPGDLINEPTVDAYPARHGQLLPDTRGCMNPLSPLEEMIVDILTCPACGEGFDVSEARNYCHNCGAKMIRRLDGLK